MKMKKVLALVCACTMALGMIGCGSDSSDSKSGKDEGSKTESQDSGSDDNKALSGTVVITGSTSVEKILNDMKDEFTAMNPNVTIEYTGSGSSAGIKDTKAGTNNIGASSREITDGEKDSNMKVETFAYDGIAAIVHPSNEVKNITMQQLQDIYSGKITNWKDLGGKDSEIFIVSREESSGTRSAFEELTGLEDAGGLTKKASVSEGNGPVQAAVAGNENAIGYVSFSFIDDSVKALTLDNVKPEAKLAKSGEYKLSRPFLFVYYEDKATDAGKAFAEFALSEDAQAIVEKHGGIRVD